MKQRERTRRGFALLPVCGAMSVLSACGTSELQPSVPLDGSPGETATDAGGGGLDGGTVVESGASDGSAPLDVTLPDACGDTQSNPVHCGSCGHDCMGAPCIAGVCSAGFDPVVIASSQTPQWIAVDISKVYWTNQEKAPAGASGSSAVVTCGAAGCNGAPTTVWAGLYGIGGLAASDASLYWPTGPGPAGADGSLPAPGGIATCGEGGCGVPAAVATVNANIEAFAADTANVYWATTVAVFECPRSGCGGDPVTLASNQNFPSAIATNGTDVFWTGGDGGQVLKCAIGGCNDSPTVLASGGIGPSVIAADGANVYWIDRGTPTGGGKEPLSSLANGQVLKCSVAGCGGAPTVLASYPTWLGAGALAVDGTDVFWSMEDVSGTWGQIVKCAIGGCGGAPVPLASTATHLSATVGLALDATRVYWTDPGSGQVLGLTK